LIWRTPDSCAWERYLLGPWMPMGGILDRYGREAVKHITAEI
jgi:hypothetical protein